MSPPDRVIAVILLQVAAPQLLARKIVGGQIAIAEMHDDHFAVGHRRRAGHVLVVVEVLVPPLRVDLLVRL